MAKQKYDELLKQVTSVFEKDGQDAGINYIADLIKNNPNSPEVYLIGGEFYLELGDIEGALNDFEKAIKIDPNEPQAYFDRGLLYAKTGEINKAVYDFSKAIELDANYVMAYSNRANMYLKLRELQKAISDCTKAIELSQNNVEPYFNRGLAYVNTGEFAKALEDYNKVIELAPKNVEAYAKCGFLHQQLGNAQDAIRNYEKFLELDPNNKNATLVRDALRDLRSSNIFSEDTLTNTETKSPLIIMIIGVVIGSIVGGIIAGSSYGTEIWVGVLTGAFFGIGLGSIPRAVKELFGLLKKCIDNIWSFAVVIFGREVRELGCLFFFFAWLFGGYWALIGALIISPFMAIYQCLVAIPSVATPSNSKNISDTADKEAKPASKKGLLITISIALVVIVVALVLHFLPTGANHSEPDNNPTPEIEIYKSFTDSRDGKTYKAVTIGEQTWMAENLNFYMEGSKCHGNNPENCEIYGRLYNWTAAKKACPPGWHLPSNAEWDALYRTADGTSGDQSPYKSETAGIYLKAKSGWNSSGNGEDYYGFAALPGGSFVGKFQLLGDNGYWWSATENNKGGAYYRFMLYESDIAGWNNNSKSLLLSVRCVQD